MLPYNTFLHPFSEYEDKYTKNPPMLSEKSIFVFIGRQKERAMFSMEEMP
jgi:hypothetical protein